MTDYLPLLAVFGIGILFLILKRRENKSRSSSGSSSTSTYRSSEGIGISFGWIVFLAIVAIIGTVIYYSVAGPNEDYKFSSQEEFNRYWTCSGVCTVSGGHVYLSGTMTLRQIPDFGAIELDLSPTTELTINVGPYIFDYYQSPYSSWFSNRDDHNLYHRMRISYNTRSTPIMHVDSGALVVGGTPRNIKVSSSWWNQIGDPYSVAGGDPEIDVDGRTIATGGRSEWVSPLPIQGTISITGQGVNIYEVKIYYHTLLKRFGINL